MTSGGRKTNFFSLPVVEKRWEGHTAVIDRRYRLWRGTNPRLTKMNINRNREKMRRLKNHANIEKRRNRKIRETR
jgi:hypothetical protein